MSKFNSSLLFRFLYRGKNISTTLLLYFFSFPAFLSCSYCHFNRLKGHYRLHVISISLMYLLITTQLSRFPRLYLHLPFVVRIFLHNLQGTEYFSTISFFFLYLWYFLSLFLALLALIRSYSRVISIFLVYLLITVQLSRFPRLSLSVFYPFRKKSIPFRLLAPLICLRSHARSLGIKPRFSLWALKREKSRRNAIKNADTVDYLSPIMQWSTSFSCWQT